MRTSLQIVENVNVKMRKLLQYPDVYKASGSQGPPFTKPYGLQDQVHIHAILMSGPAVPSCITLYNMCRCSQNRLGGWFRNIRIVVALLTQKSLEARVQECWTHSRYHIAAEQRRVLHCEAQSALPTL